MSTQRAMWVVWPSFLVAAVLEMVVFALVDPDQTLAVSREAVSTLAFFLFWGAAMVSSALSLVLALPSMASSRNPLVPVGSPAEPTKGEIATDLSGSSAD